MRAAQGCVAEIIETFQAKLRSLRGHLVLRAALRIHPEGGRGLKAARQGHEHVAGHGLFGQADELRLGAVDIDIELRIVARLVNVQIHRARYGCAIFAAARSRNARLAGTLKPTICTSMGDGQAEVQYLSDHVRGQKRKLSSTGKSAASCLRNART